MDAPTADQTVVLAGRYRLGLPLGRGGMSDVFDGMDERLGRPVAVKILRPELASDPDLRRRFEAEARAAARLTHPHVVGVYDTGEDQGRAFIVMERLPGQTLATYMEDGLVEERWLRRVAAEVLAALGAAHAAGIVHRDVKPGNILIDAAGSAKVGDFGIAKSAEGLDPGLTRTGVLIGTPAYLAPERVDGAPATAQSDLYGLGVLLYEALAGRKPFDGTTPLAVAYAARHNTPEPLTALRPDVAPALATLVAKAMDVDPARRWPSAAAMAEALAAAPGPSPDGRAAVSAQSAPTSVMASGPTPTQVLTLAAAPLGGPRRRRWLAGGLVAAFVALAAALLAASTFRGHSSAAPKPPPTTATTAAPTTTTPPTTAAVDTIAAELNQVADGLSFPKDGLMATTLADGLRQVASTDAQGRPAAADSLLRQATQWRQARLLQSRAYQAAATALLHAGASKPSVDGGGGGGD